MPTSEKWEQTTYLQLSCVNGPDWYKLLFYDWNNIRLRKRQMTSAGWIVGLGNATITLAEELA